MNHPAHHRSPSPTALTALCIAGLAVSASILVLLLPTLFQPGAHIHPLVLAGLVLLCTAFAIGARYWHPPTPRSTNG